jgi:hypothetical protein
MKIKDSVFTKTGTWSFKNCNRDITSLRSELDLIYDENFCQEFWHARDDEEKDRTCLACSIFNLPSLCRRVLVTVRSEELAPQF